MPRPVERVRNLSGDGVGWRSGPQGLAVSVDPPDRGQPVTVLEIVMTAQ
jgi:hypothetical protein